MRPVLGVLAIAGRVPAETVWPLAIVVLACATDFVDGRIARGMSGDTTAGRLVDNLCDFAFLFCMFVWFGTADLWSQPVWGRLLRVWDGANFLPVYALAGSFGTYYVRLERDLRAGRTPERSPSGHAAGVANYGLALVGATQMLPDVELGPPLLEPVMLGVTLLNVIAIVENASLMFHLHRGGPRMPS